MDIEIEYLSDSITISNVRIHRNGMACGFVSFRFDLSTESYIFMINWFDQHKNGKYFPT